MPIIIYALLGITTVGTAALVFGKAVDNTTTAASAGASKFIVPAAAAFGIYAAYKAISKG